jgi:hypothetical protein
MQGGTLFRPPTSAIVTSGISTIFSALVCLSLAVSFQLLVPFYEEVMVLRMVEEKIFRD